MLENTLGLFTVAAVYLTWRGLAGRHSAPWLSGAGLCVFAGLLVKGPPALYPLVVPVLYGVVFRNRRWQRVAADSLIAVLACALPLVLLVALSPDARVSLGNYVDAQIIHSFANVQTVGSRFAILQRLFKELLPTLLLTALILGFGRRKGFDLARLRSEFRPAIFFVLVGMAASFPFMITLKQSGFYLVPSFPYYALAFATLAAPVVESVQERLDPERPGFRRLMALSLALAVAALMVAAAQLNRIGRDCEKLLAAYAVIDLVPPRTTIDVCPAMGVDWTLHGYCARYGFLSLDRDERTQQRYLFSDRSCYPYQTGIEQQFELPTDEYLLFERRIESGTPP
jgi:4-amino-4-deoxy-L-arabinose transferase-like glycosyltransferase